VKKKSLGPTTKPESALRLIKSAVVCFVFFVGTTTVFAQVTFIETAQLVIEVRHDPFAIHFRNTKGEMLAKGGAPADCLGAISGFQINDKWQRITRIAKHSQETDRHIFEAVTDAGTAAQVVFSTPDPFRIQIEIRADEKAQSVGFAFECDSTQHFAGMGQRFNSLNLYGQEIPTSDQPWTVPIPFFITRGYGLYVETGGPFTFDFGTRDAQTYSFWVDHSQLVFHFIYGPTPKEVVGRYTALTGRAMTPPDWQFGVWKWRDWVFDETEIYEDATMLQSLDIPAKVILIDSPWSNEYIDYEFNPKQFPNPKKLIDDLHGMGYRVVLWMVPFISPAAENFAEADQKGFFVADSTGKTYQIEWWRPSGTDELGLTSDGKGGMIDFTNPAAVKWWQNQIAKVVDLGVDGFKMDDCDPYILPGDAALFNGQRGREIKNYSLHYVKAVHDLMQEKRNGDFVLMPRSGAAGSQKFVSAFWAADQSPNFDPKTGLPSVILGGQSIGLVGFPFWGSDVGGYQWSPPKEVFARWLQFGAFSPVMEIGGKSYHEPWMFDDELEMIFRRYTQLHTYLFPYIKHYADEAAKTGVPIMRPMFLEFPDDAKTYEAEFQYMFGGELLVAPVHQSALACSVYFPKGQWIDFWTQEVFAGPKTISQYPAPLDQLPLFIRVSEEARTRLLAPLFLQQAAGLKGRVEYVLRGEKKILLAKPARRLHSQFDLLAKMIPENPPQLTSSQLHTVLAGIRAFRDFLNEEADAGQIPHHVHLTLSARLEDLSRTAKGILSCQ
jgi:alpha-D-xyloside xylohydrolase